MRLIIRLSISLLISRYRHPCVYTLGFPHNEKRRLTCRTLASQTTRILPLYIQLVNRARGPSLSLSLGRLTFLPVKNSS